MAERRTEGDARSRPRGDYRDDGLFTGITHGIPISIKKISSAADVAVVKGNVSGLRIRRIALADGRHSAIGGSPVVLLGYPTGVDAILARTAAATLQAIGASSKGDPKQVMEELARRHLIKPVVTQGHIGEVLANKIVYDSRRPPAVPVARSSMIKVRVSDFGGSNPAIPVGFGKSLLKP